MLASNLSNAVCARAVIGHSAKLEENAETLTILAVSGGGGGLEGVKQWRSVRNVFS